MRGNGITSFASKARRSEDSQDMLKRSSSPCSRGQCLLKVIAMLGDFFVIKRRSSVCSFPAPESEAFDTSAETFSNVEHTAQLTLCFIMRLSWLSQKNTFESQVQFSNMSTHDSLSGDRSAPSDLRGSFRPLNRKSEVFFWPPPTLSMPNHFMW